ncbi:MAG: APC family permease, partial [Bacteroidetes bacterium]|nr:APC family permease [Bacteroidota bacterium]
KRFGFYEGWWTWLYTFVDLAIYPVLFVEYLSFFFPQLGAFKIPVCLAIVWSGAILNILGISPVGKATLLLSFFVITPFIILFILAFHGHGQFMLPSPSLKGIPFSSLGLALYTVMWNFFGWDNATTYAEEVDKPVRSYLKSTLIAFAAVMCIYVMTVYATLRFHIGAKMLNDEGYPALGVMAGGKWLGSLIAIGGMAGALGLFSSVLLSISRVPEVMAQDGFLPKKLKSLHPKYNTPHISIIVCAMVISFMILWSFEELIIIDVTLYGTALFLEFATLIVLRIKAPAEKRPFRVPLPTWALVVVYMLPVSVYSIALSGALISEEKKFLPAAFAIGALLSAELAWQAVKWWRNR